MASIKIINDNITDWDNGLGGWLPENKVVLVQVDDRDDAYAAISSHPLEDGTFEVVAFPTNEQGILLAPVDLAEGKSLEEVIEKLSVVADECIEIHDERFNEGIASILGEDVA